MWSGARSITVWRTHLVAEPAATHLVHDGGHVADVALVRGERLCLRALELWVGRLFELHHEGEALLLVRAEADTLGEALGLPDNDQQAQHQQV